MTSSMTSSTQLYQLYQFHAFSTQSEEGAAGLPGRAVCPTARGFVQEASQCFVALERDYNIIIITNNIITTYDFRTPTPTPSSTFSSPASTSTSTTSPPSPTSSSPLSFKEACLVNSRHLDLWRIRAQGLTGLTGLVGLIRLTGLIGLRTRL